jgi:protease PrsW
MSDRGGPHGGYGHQGHAHHAFHSHPPPPHEAPEPDPDRGHRLVGLWLWIIGIAIGLVLNVLFTYAEIRFSKNPDMGGAILLGAVLAFPPLLVYLFVPAIIDRYDPEPWWCLAMAFLWGAITATGFAGMINTAVGLVGADALGEEGGKLVTTVISAPIAEEFWKGLCILGFFYFLRREFDGVIDGIIYATFCALGFAAVENVSYYARAHIEGGNVLASTFVIRGMLAPWGHPLYTSMTGIGFGLARESHKTWVKVLAPMAGFSAGVLLHATWNFVPTAFGGGVFLASLLLWFIFVALFFVIIVVLVVRKGRVIRQHLYDEVLVGNLTSDELELVCSPVGRLRATFSWRGATGRRFIRAGARLALCKWHTARAMKGQKRTISADFIAPLRQELKRLRADLAARAPRSYGQRY